MAEGGRYQSSIYRYENCNRNFYSQQSIIICDLFDIQRFMIVKAHLAGASVFRASNLIGFSRTTVSRSMTAYAKLGKLSSAKQNSGETVSGETVYPSWHVYDQLG